MTKNIAATFSDALNLAYFVLFDIVLFSFRYSGYSVPALVAILSTPEVPNAKHNSDWHSKLSVRLFGASSRARAYFLLGEETSSDCD